MRPQVRKLWICIRVWESSLYLVSSLAVEHSNILPAFRRRHNEILELSALAARLNRCVERGMHLEFHIPFVDGECRKEEHRAGCIVQRSHNHVVESGAHEAEVIKGRLVVLVVLSKSRKSEILGRASSSSLCKLGCRVVG